MPRGVDDGGITGIEVLIMQCCREIESTLLTRAYRYPVSFPPCYAHGTRDRWRSEGTLPEVGSDSLKAWHCAILDRNQLDPFVNVDVETFRTSSLFVRCQTYVFHHVTIPLNDGFESCIFYHSFLQQSRVRTSTCRLVDISSVHRLRHCARRTVFLVFPCYRALSHFF